MTAITERGEEFFKFWALIDPKRQFIMCTIPKVSGTFWRKRLSEAFHLKEESKQGKHSALSIPLFFASTPKILRKKITYLHFQESH